MAPDSPASSLAQHLEALYPLACVLAGPDHADTLVERTYQRAAEVPPGQRPSDERAWLFRLLTTVREEASGDRSADASGESLPSSDDDSFRRAVAVQTARRHLPGALAACSARQRVALTLDVFDADEHSAAAALDLPIEEARSVREQARSALRASLRDVLNGPERMLVDVALPDEALRRLLRGLLEEEFLPIPSALEQRVRRQLAANRSGSSDEDEARTAPSAGGTWAAVRRRLNTRTSILVGLVVVFVTGGLAGLAYFDSPTPPSPSSQSLIALTAERTGDISSTQDTKTPSAAADVIRKTWDRRVSVPSLQGAVLQGVGRLPLDDRVDVPALLYRDDESGSRIVAYVFNYALLDRVGDRVRLGPSLRRDLAANQSPLTRRRADRALVLWRQRDDIFVLVAPNTTPDTLRSRLQLGGDR